jgi:chorismate mutase
VTDPTAKRTPEQADAQAELSALRGSIDNIDAALVHLLAERFKFTQRVGRLKAVAGLPAADRDREQRQIARLRALAEQSHLDPAFAEKWLTFIMAEVIRHHVRIAADSNGSAPEPGEDSGSQDPPTRAG